MKTTKKFLCVLLSLIMLLSICGSFSASAAPKLKGIEVTKIPEQLKFYRETDWDYGKWDQVEDIDPWIWVPGQTISFLRNPGGGHYGDAGMINAQGLEIVATYSDGSKKTIKYKEFTKDDGTLGQNIVLSPQGGLYKVGKNNVEVWLIEDYRYYDTYEIEIIDSAPPAPQRQKGDVNNDSKINSSDALLVLQHSVSLITLDSTQIKFADMNDDKKCNSSDALKILQKSVGN